MYFFTFVLSTNLVVTAWLLFFTIPETTVPFLAYTTAVAAPGVVMATVRWVVPACWVDGYGGWPRCLRDLDRGSFFSSVPAYQAAMYDLADVYMFSTDFWLGFMVAKRLACRSTPSNPCFENDAFEKTRVARTIFFAALVIVHFPTAANMFRLASREYLTRYRYRPGTGVVVRAIRWLPSHYAS
jgi:hypothetical protein